MKLRRSATLSRRGSQGSIAVGKQKPETEQKPAPSPTQTLRGGFGHLHGHDAKDRGGHIICCLRESPVAGSGGRGSSKDGGTGVRAFPGANCNPAANDVSPSVLRVVGDRETHTVEPILPHMNPEQSPGHGAMRFAEQDEEIAELQTRGSRRRCCL